MNTAVAVNASKVVPQGVSSVQDIPLTNIQESRTNPRRTFDETKLAELADNIRQHGVLQPVLVRPRMGTRANPKRIGPTQSEHSRAAMNRRK